MALHDDPPHRTSIARLATATDPGAGVSDNYTTVQAAVPCSIGTLSADEVQRYAVQQIRVTHCVAYLASDLNQPLLRGMLITADDTGSAYHVKGVRSGRTYGTIPAFVYADVEELL